MGKRRVRNLRALGHETIVGIDPRSDRRHEAGTTYGILTFSDMSSALAAFEPDALIISTDPRLHMDYAEAALARGLPCFIEASVVEAARILELSRAASRAGVVMAPSCTMRYYPGPRKIAELLGQNTLGKVLNFNYVTGQWLPDWHPWEAIGDFYVSRRETGGCREIVPFELTWLDAIFGASEPVACLRARVSDMPADIDDIYHCLLRYPGGTLGNITVEVLSRPVASRELRVVGSNGLLVFSSDENCVRVSTVEHPEWQRYALDTGTVESGYINPEEPYIAEMRDFVAAITNNAPSLFPNTLMDDWRVLSVLDRLDAMSGSNT